MTNNRRCNFPSLWVWLLQRSLCSNLPYFVWGLSRPFKHNLTKTPSGSRFSQGASGTLELSPSAPTPESLPERRFPCLTHHQSNNPRNAETSVLNCNQYNHLSWGSAACVLKVTEWVRGRREKRRPRVLWLRVSERSVSAEKEPH